jgi:hypothetical protein
VRRAGALNFRLTLALAKRAERLGLHAVDRASTDSLATAEQALVQGKPGYFQSFQLTQQRRPIKRFKGREADRFLIRLDR